MPDREAIQKGLDFETKVGEALGLDPTVASGNRWHDQGDARGRGLLVSCKANPVAKRSWAQTRAQLREAIEMGAGSGRLPALAIEDDDGAALVLLRLEDLAELLGGDQRAPAASMKRSARVRAAAAVPLLRRQQ